MRRKHSEHRIPSKRRSPILRRSVEKMKESLNCGSCSRKSCCNYAKRLFPFTRMLNGYSGLYDLPCDLIAGLTVGIMHIPQGMAYALLTQLPPVYGLYTSFFPVLIYFIFGTSKHISVGTFAVVSLMVGAVVDKGHVAWQRQELQGAIHDIEAGQNITHSIGGVTTTLPPPAAVGEQNLTAWDQIFRRQHISELEAIKVGYAMAVTFAVGLLQVFLGTMRLGFLTTFLSDPLISGFTTGAAIHVFSSQVKSAFGVKVKRFSGPLKLIFSYKDFFSNLNQANIVTMTATIVAIMVLVAIREGINNNKTFKEKMKGIPVPGELMVIIGGTVLSSHYQLHREFDVEVIGHIPKGFPTASLSFMKYMPDVIGESFAICFTGFAISFAVAKILADKHNYVVDPNQELVAHGLSNILGSMCSSFCSSASLSRSMVQDGVGGKTQIVSLVSSVLVVIVLLALGPLFESLPNSILAAIIIVSLKGLFLQFGELKRLWRVSKVDYTVWLVTFLSTVFLDVDLGLLIGLIYNLVPILLRTQEPYVTLLGRLPDTDVYVDTKVYSNAVPVSGIKIFKFEAPLYFANMEKFKAALVKETGVDPHYLRTVKANIKETDMTLRHHEVCMATSDTWPDEPCESHGNGAALNGQTLPANCETFAIIIDGSAIQYVDSVTVRVLKEIVLEFRQVDIEIFLGECKAPVRVMLDKSGFYQHVYRRNVCATIHHAVQVALKSAAMSRETLDSCYTMAAEEFLSDAGFDKLELETSLESVDRIAEPEEEEKN
ncbi:prestin [Aplysia californica]|uniref:Prestin n=1 Tax=Aplysia californica TaxID=6500 RepID=A0ABM1VSG4_APLCA|nr:prestin [Aplysia californica]